MQTKIDYVSDVYEKFDGNVASRNMIFIDGSNCSDTQLSQSISGFSGWIKEHNLKSANQIIC